MCVCMYIWTLFVPPYLSLSAPLSALHFKAQHTWLDYSCPVFLLKITHPRLSSTNHLTKVLDDAQNGDMIGETCIDLAQRWCDSYSSPYTNPLLLIRTLFPIFMHTCRLHAQACTHARCFPLHVHKCVIAICALHSWQVQSTLAEQIWSVDCLCRLSVTHTAKNLPYILGFVCMLVCIIDVFL